MLRSLLIATPLVTSIFAILVIVPASAQRTKPPRFEDYRVSNIYKGEVKGPEFGNLNQYSGTDLRCFGGDPADYAKEPVNFAGHFVVQACTCGSGCHYLYMWDASSGKVYESFPAMPIDVGPFGRSPSPVEYKGEEYRLDSSLLIIEGCIEDTCNCARRYYKWTGRQFRLILRASVPMPPECKR